MSAWLRLTGLLTGSLVTGLASVWVGLAGPGDLSEGGIYCTLLSAQVDEHEVSRADYELCAEAFESLPIDMRDQLWEQLSVR